MGWKIVRDRQPGYCLKNGVSGQWRISPDPVAALGKKIGEEYGEYVGEGSTDELYDLRDVIDRLIKLVDPDGLGGKIHADKVAELGGFEDLTEWCPVPVAYRR